MPNKKEHLVKARHNEDFVDSLDIATTKFLDWAVTALFYSGVHYIEAYFSLRNIHSPDHRSRDSDVRRDPVLRTLYRDFSELKNYSMNARYFMLPFVVSDVQKLKKNLAAIRARIEPLL